jgi:hypothetical protein
MPANQTKIADLIIRLKLARLATYYTAYLWDLGWDITVESNVTKVFNVEGTMQSSLDAVQVMGGDGVTPFYPAQSILEIAKVEHISGGTMEACRMVIFKSGVKQLEEDLKMRRRVIHKDLGVPVPASGVIKREKNVNEEKVLSVLAEDYRVNPGLFMSRGDIAQYLDVDDARLDSLLEELEKKGFAKLYRTKKGISLAKATYDGLSKAHPKEYYRWFPAWVTQDRRF